ncbi:hypothetical protein T4A_3102 [Trichinella pseudospiralis]|uniref:Uncharacterized protein n=1 Tax=Trichinella pseudospiralis TaxID=6337 RepID=A0A0V1DLM9_TRIPS|nr:hypothetical protein T4A_3102 [Trichinella pseudospiralis]
MRFLLRADSKQRFSILLKAILALRALRLFVKHVSISRKSSFH